MANVNRPWPECCATGVASYNVDDFLPDPHNFHSNPGYMGTSTGSMVQQAQPGGMYRTAGPRTGMSSGDAGHQPMRYGGRRPNRAPGRTITPAAGDREPVSEGSPLVVQTGGSQW